MPSESHDTLRSAVSGRRAPTSSADGVGMANTIRKLAALIDRPNKVRFAGLLGMMVVGGLLEIVGIGAIPAFISAVADPETVRRYPSLHAALTTVGVTTSRQILLWGAVALIAVFLVKNGFLVLLHYLQSRITYRFHANIRHALFRQYMTAPYAFHLNRNTAELLRNVNTEASHVVERVINPLLLVLLNGLMTGFVLVLVVALEPIVALISLSLLGASSLAFLTAIRARTRSYGQEAQAESRATIQAVQQGLGSLKEARVLGREGYFVDEFRRGAEAYARAERFKYFASNLATPILEFLAVAGLLGIALALVMMGESVASIVPTLALFGAAIVRLRATVSATVQHYTNAQYAQVAVTPVHDDLKQLQGTNGRPAGDNERGTPSAGRPLRRVVALEGVCYRYPGARAWALRDISLRIRKGTSVAFVGPTGSGKTTVVDVVMGLLTPQSGTVRVDGRDVRENLRGWQDQIGYIPQSIYLLDDTIRRNVAFGLPDAAINDEKVWTALRAAQLEGMVRSLDEGLDARTGEHGVRISGGQRQRIGIARALYHNPEVLVMDEATSALDTITERLLVGALDALRSDRTVIMIAHRLSTVRGCDQIFFLDGGRIRAAGTYDELYETHGDFRKMAAPA